MSHSPASQTPAVDLQTTTPDELQTRLKRVRQRLKQARVKRPTADTIHDLRVSTRRATAAVQSLTEFLPNQPADTCLSTLKKVRHLAGDVRDLDILLTRFVSDNNDPELPITGKQLKDLRKFVERRRRKLARRLREYRLQPKQEKVQKTLPHKLRWRGEGEQPDSHALAQSAVGHCAQQSLQLLDPWPSDPPSLHELRLSLKRLRYSVEFFRDLIGTNEFDPVHRKLKRLQVELGAISDGRAMLDILERLQHHCPQKQVQVVAALQRHEQDKLAETCEKFLAKWTDKRSKELRTMLSTLAESESSNSSTVRNEAC